MSKSEALVSAYCRKVMQKSAFREALFREPSGTWVPVSCLCEENGVDPPPRTGPGRDLCVTWMRTPEVDGHATVMFYSCETFWATLATPHVVKIPELSRQEG